jgi:hypothetical protein
MHALLAIGGELDESGRPIEGVDQRFTREDPHFSLHGAAVEQTYFDR